LRETHETHELRERAHELKQTVSRQEQDTTLQQEREERQRERIREQEREEERESARVALTERVTKSEEALLLSRTTLSNLEIEMRDLQVFVCVCVCVCACVFVCACI